MNIITGKVYVLGDNIDTDQILSAEYIRVNPSTEEGYAMLGRLAMCGLPLGSEPFRDPKGNESPYSIIIAGSNFGCGSSREHAVIALGSSGVKAVLAKSFARIFYRNCIVTGELLPLTYSSTLSDIRTGDIVSIDLDKNVISTHHEMYFSIDQIGELLGIVQQGGLFNYARYIGKIKKKSANIKVKEIL